MENSIYLKLILRGLVLLIAEKARDYTTPLQQRMLEYVDAVNKLLKNG